MFASPIKQSTQNGRRVLAVQNMGKDDYDRIANFPSRMGADKSTGIDPVMMPAALNRDEIGLKPTQKPSPPPAPITRKPLEEIPAYIHLIIEK